MGSCYMLTYIYVSDFLSPSRIKTRHTWTTLCLVSKPFHFKSKFHQKINFKESIMEKNQPLFFSLLGSVSQKVQLRFSFTCSTNQNKRNQMSQVFIYFNHSYVLSIQSYLPKIKRGPSVFISKHLTYQRIETFYLSLFTDGCLSVNSKV